MIDTPTGFAKVETNQLTGRELDYCVLWAITDKRPEIVQFVKRSHSKKLFSWLFDKDACEYAPAYHFRRYDPSRNWAYAGPAMEQCFGLVGKPAMSPTDDGKWLVEGIIDQHLPRAVMKFFVFKKFGESVYIPEEIVEKR